MRCREGRLSLCAIDVHPDRHKDGVGGLIQAEEDGNRSFNEPFSRAFPNDLSCKMTVNGARAAIKSSQQLLPEAFGALW